ncbi:MULTISPECIES: DUF6883 domain-containing protein [unclassified Synechocystis]|uniref:DUF6883 domain-containing protein n=1 Tax=unclassified Synechocystis TaxID=2640012 RepID=UPI0004173B3C|nr:MULTISPECIES: DUF6883 domain-containing protein [unclassified Synechocystis]AIE75893.1 hypothetical protein D082_33650 [Synechocystis sp. PCC 6714]MCT0255181.1 hypothetical protein [Synechocystis sp. CS-94]
MKLAQDSIITQEKLTDYLLKRLPKDDKSQYLARAGYTRSNWRQLEQDLRQQILTLDAIPTGKTQFGQKYEIIGFLKGPNGKCLNVKTIWIVTETDTRLVTLLPA